MKRNQQNQLPKKILELDNLVYLLNEEEKTAGVTGHNNQIEDIKIPTSIIFNSQEYIITSIFEYAFKYTTIKSIQFSEDSQLQMIEKEAFFNTSITSIKIPSQVTRIGKRAFSHCQKLQYIEIPEDSNLEIIDKLAFSFSSIESITITSKVVELKEGWSSYTSKLMNVKVSLDNPRYFCVNEQYIIGKSSINQPNYDEFVFCVRNVESLKIPNYIKHICSYAFSECNYLHSIEIPNDSILKTIGKEAFFNSSIDFIKIPSSLVDLNKGWCNHTSKLVKIIVDVKNPLFCCINEKMLIKKSSVEQLNYNELVFCARNVDSIKIPDFIEHINAYAFSECNHLRLIEFSNDSRLQTIGNESFIRSSITCIKIPSSVTKIGKGAFSTSKKLEKIEIPNDSKLEIIEGEAFIGTLIKMIKIPSSVTHIGKSAFSWCYQLQQIEIPVDSKLQIIDEESFSRTEIKSFTVPSNVTQIKDSAFSECSQLEKIEFLNDSKLQLIEKEAFSKTSIRSIKIPSEVTRIGEAAFYECTQLCKIEFFDDSKLH